MGWYYCVFMLVVFTMTVNKDVLSRSPNRVILNKNRLKALELRVSGKKYREIGDIMGVTEARAHQQVRNAMKQIIKARSCEARLAPGLWDDIEWQ